MRVIAFVSLAFTLAASAMPLPGNDAAEASHLVAATFGSGSTIPGGVTGDVSHPGGKVKSAAAGIHAPNGVGSRAVAPNSIPGAGAVLGAVNDAAGSVKGAHSITSTPGEVKGDVSNLEGKVKSTPGDVGPRAIGGGLGGASGVVGKVGKAAGAAGKGKDAAKLLPGGKGGVAKAVGGAASGPAGKLGGATRN